MLFYDNTLKILNRDGRISDVNDSLKDEYEYNYKYYNKYCSAKIKSCAPCKRDFDNKGYIILTTDNKLLFFSYLFEIDCMVDLVNINPMYVTAIYEKFVCDPMQHGIGCGCVRCILYTLKDNQTIILTHIFVTWKDHILTQYVIEKEEIKKFDNITKFEPLNDFDMFEIHNDNNVLLTNNTLAIINKRNVKLINKEKNNFAVNKYCYVHLNNNNIYLDDIVTGKNICIMNSVSDISKIIHLDDNIIFALDNKNNLYAYHFSTYKEEIYDRNLIINIGDSNIKIFRRSNQKLYIYFNNGKIYDYCCIEKKISRIYNGNYNITLVNNIYMYPLFWNMHNHKYFDSKVKKMVENIVLCNKYTKYKRICKPILYEIFNLLIKN